jgi:hypothetical protein
MTQYNFFLKNIVIALFAFLAPLQTFMLCVGFLIIADMLIALTAALKSNIKITSRKLSHTLSKVVVYNLVVLSVYAFQLTFFPQLALVELVCFLICITEVKSIDENLKKGWGISFYDKMMNMIKRNDVNENKDEKEEGKEV